MIKRSFFLCILVLTTLVVFTKVSSANEIPCVSKEQSKIFEPTEHIRGYGIREGALIKLSVSSEGYWLVTLSPPEMDGAVCIVFMGTDWKFITSDVTKQEVNHGRGN